ncbi:MAG: hypothetical protein ACFE96_14110 [Candidatus Hermodarchaeota archaeon]
MAQAIICPVCKSQLQEMTKGHLITKKHTHALKLAFIDPFEDPALSLIPDVQERIIESVPLSLIEQRLLNLEEIVYHLYMQLEKILSDSELENAKTRNERTRYIRTNEILEAINICVQINKKRNRWVKIDDIVEILEVNCERDLESFDRKLIKMFNRNLIEFAKGSHPIHSILYQDNAYGMVALQN